MTSREVLDLLEARGRAEVTYSELVQAMAKLGLTFEARKYQGFVLRCYLGVEAIHALAFHFGVDLGSYDAKGRRVHFRPDRRELVTFHN